MAGIPICPIVGGWNIPQHPRPGRELVSGSLWSQHGRQEFFAEIGHYDRDITCPTFFVRVSEQQ